MTPAAQRLFAYHVAAAHAVLRVTFGAAVAMQGWVRLRADPGAFADRVVDEFVVNGSVLPRAAVRVVAVAVPYAEAVLGGLLLLGLFSLPTLVAAGLGVAVLVAGDCSMADASAAGGLMPYAIVVFVLIAGQPYDQWSVDGLLRGAFRRD